MINPFPESINRLGIFALSGFPDSARLETAISRLSTWGIQSILSLPEGGPRRFLAGSDSNRLTAFHRLLSTDNPDFLIAAKGGYGVTRILDELDWELLRRKNPVLCGYSDVTALLLAAYAHGCTRLLHGPMVCSTFGREESPELVWSLNCFAKALQGEIFPGMAEQLPFLCRMSPLRKGQATGPLIPCNLTLLCALAGTAHFPDLKGSILAVEDIFTPAHDIDRKLNQLKSMGVLKQLGGLIFGQFNEVEDREYLPEILQEYAVCVPGPVLCGAPFGHLPASSTLWMGARFTLICND